MSVRAMKGRQRPSLRLIHGMLCFIYFLSTLKGVYLTGFYLWKRVVTTDTERRVEDTTRNDYSLFYFRLIFRFIQNLISQVVMLLRN